MGFTPRGRVYVLDFTGDEELDGLEVKVRSSSIGMLLDMGDLAADVTVEGKADPLGQVKRLRPVLERFAEVLVSWDMEVKPGVPTPATLEGLLQVETGQVMRIIGAYQQAVASVPTPLPSPSSGGAPSLEGSLPMETLSPSLAS